MADEITVKGLSGLDAALKKYGVELSDAAGFGVMSVGLAVEAEAKKLLKLRSRKRKSAGHIGGDGTPPNRITGALMNSLVTERKQGFGGKYVATVYPTMEYARALEFGNPRWKSGVKYPYMAPALKIVEPRAQRIFVAAVRSKMKG